jgi:DNA-binding ferritin-like protein (Dps family)
VETVLLNIWRVKMNKIIDSLKTLKKEKAEYKANRKLLESLPDDYQFVFKQIDKYMFSFATDGSMLTVLMDILESLAVAAPDGRSVFSITGKNVGSFCNNLIKNCHAKMWQDTQREKLNKNIHKNMEQ